MPSPMHDVVPLQHADEFLDTHPVRLRGLGLLSSTHDPIAVGTAMRLKEGLRIGIGI